MKKMYKMTCMAALTLLFILMIPGHANAAVKRTTTLDLTGYTKTEINNAQGWIWSPATKTLTLKGVDIEVDDDYAIKLPDDSATILLSGKNVLKANYAAISSEVGIGTKEDQGTLCVRPSGADVSLELTSGTKGFQYKGDMVLDNFNLTFHGEYCFSFVRNITFNNMTVTATGASSAYTNDIDYSLIHVKDEDSKKMCCIELRNCYVAEGGSVIRNNNYFSYIGTEATKSPSTIKIMPGTPPAVGKGTIQKITKNYKELTLQWTAGKYSNGIFEVYRSTKKSSGYQKIATLTKLTYTDKKLTFNKTYYYKIKCKNLTSEAYSAVKSAKTAITTPSYAEYSHKSTKDALSWNKVYGATGYKIYRASSVKGKYSLVYTIKKGSKVSCTLKRPSKKKYYYYKIQAVRKQGKKTYSSAKKTVYENDD